MPRVRLAVVVAALVALLAPAGPAAAAELVDVSGTVLNGDGSPGAEASVTVLVAGTDLVYATTADDQGAFTVQVEAAIGDTLEVEARGETISTEPDEEGCVRSWTPAGGTSVILETLPPPSIGVAMADGPMVTVCTATGEPAPAVTPPATDAASTARSQPGTGIAAWLGLLALAGAGALVAARRRAA